MKKAPKKKKLILWNPLVIIKYLFPGAKPTVLVYHKFWISMGEKYIITFCKIENWKMDMELFES